MARVVSLVGVVLVLGFYAELVAHAPATGQDLRNFYAAATVLRDGGNPYDIHQLLHAETRLYHPHTAAQQAALAGNPYVQGPPLAIALMPMTGRPSEMIYDLTAILLICAAAGALALLARMSSSSTTGRHRAAEALRWGIVLLISPVTFLGVLLGQPDAVLLLLVVAALALYRRRPLPAGLILTLGLIKPQLMAGPLVLYGVLAWKHGNLGRYMLGVLTGALIFGGGSAAIVGPAVVVAWLHALVSFGGVTVYTQVDISSLSTLYVGWAPHALSLALMAAGVFSWAALCIGAWRAGARHLRADPAKASHGNTAGSAARERWWLLVGLTGWLLVTPYAHPHDDVLLLPAVWYLLERGPYAPRYSRAPVLVLAALLFAAWWLLPMTSLLALRPPVVRGLGIIPIALLLGLLATQRPNRPQAASPDRAIGPYRIAS